MVEQKTATQEMTALDADKVEALRKQLRTMLGNGQSKLPESAVVKAVPTHSSHSDGDGFI
jgi:hypothetical protein